jgi:hypothetical protein
VKVKCFSTLVKENKCGCKGSTEYELPDGATVQDLIERLNLPLEAIKIVFLNTKEVEFATGLHSGDQSLSPVTGRDVIEKSRKVLTAILFPWRRKSRAFHPR